MRTMIVLPLLCLLPLEGGVAFGQSAPVPPQARPPLAVRAAEPVPAAARPTVPRRKPARPTRRPLSSVVAPVAKANAAARRAPVLQNYINATQVYAFSEGALYQLFTAPERVSDIELEPGETLVSVAAGDTARWVIGDTSSGSGETRRTHILVKPFAAGLATNLVITTDRRSYHLSLASSAGAAMVSVRWTYPQDALIALKRAEAAVQQAAPVAAGLALDQLRFDYRIEGDQPRWRPIRAFDDGRQTFIEFPADLAAGEAPPLFLLDGKSEAQLVNYRVRGRFYIVDRLFDRAELRLGTKNPTVVRIQRVDVTARTRRGA